MPARLELIISDIFCFLYSQCSGLKIRWCGSNPKHSHGLRRDPCGLSSSVVDPDSSVRIRIQGFNEQKLKNNIAKKCLKIFFRSKTAIHLSLVSRPPYRKSKLQEKPSALPFSFFVGLFCSPGSGSGSTTLAFKLFYGHTIH
jgi:hypothetical protein